MRALAAVALAACSFAALAAEEVIDVATRPGVTVTYLLVASPEAHPRAIVVTLIGGTGAINLRSRASRGPVQFTGGANFLIRVRDAFDGADMVDAIVDAPSDHLPQGMNDAFRMSDEHAEDIAAVIADLRKRYPDAKVYAIGTSRGTTSAASFAARHPEMLAGAVLSSTVTVPDRVGPNLSRFDFASLHLPVLLVHHRDDACRSSPYSGVERLKARFPLTTVEGGDPPESEPCEPRAPHGYLGRETATAEAIRQWMLTGAVTPLVH